MASRISVALLALLALGPAAPRLAAQDERLVTAKNFTQMRELIKPTAAEAGYAQIPWLVDLTEARRKAAAEDKPLFVWTMSGEALGVC